MKNWNSCCSRVSPKGLAAKNHFASGENPTLPYKNQRLKNRTHFFAFYAMSVFFFQPTPHSLAFRATKLVSRSNLFLHASSATIRFLLTHQIRKLAAASPSFRKPSQTLLVATTVCVSYTAANYDALAHQEQARNREIQGSFFRAGSCIRILPVDTYTLLSVARLRQH